MDKPEGEPVVYTPQHGNRAMDKAPGKGDPKQIYFIAAVLGILLVFVGIGSYILFQPKEPTSEVPLQSTPINPPPILSPTVATAVQQEAPVVAKKPTAAPTTTPVPTPSKRWNFFLNQTYKFVVQYPPDWKATTLGALEPLVPGYFTFNPKAATPAAELAITVSSTTRTYQEVVALQAASQSAVTINGVKGIKTSERNSDGDESIHIVLPGKKYVYILVAKKKYEQVFNLMYQTFKILP